MANLEKHDLWVDIEGNWRDDISPNGEWVKFADVAEALTPSHNSDYAAALRVWREEWLPLVAYGNHIGNFAWYCEKRLNAEEPHCA